MDNSFNHQPDSPVRTPSEHISSFFKRPIVLFVGLLSIAAAVLFIFSLLNSNVGSAIAALSDNGIGFAAGAISLSLPFAIVSAAFGVIILIIFFISSAGSSPSAFLNAAVVMVSLRLTLSLIAAGLFIYASVNSVFIDCNANIFFSSLFNLQLGEQHDANIFYSATGYLLLIALCVLLALNAVYHIAALRLALGVIGVFKSKVRRISCSGTIFSFNTASVLCYILLAAAEVISKVVRIIHGESIDPLPLIFILTATALFAVKSRAVRSLSSHILFAEFVIRNEPSPTQHYGDGFSDDDS